MIVALALCVGLGGHWALLQVVAWTGMLISYSQESTIEEALTKTFDGEHPCSMCKKISKGRETEQKQKSRTVSVEKTELKFVKPSGNERLAPKYGFGAWRAVSQEALARSSEPAVPPPRA